LHRPETIAGEGDQSTPNEQSTGGSQAGLIRLLDLLSATKHSGMPYSFTIMEPSHSDLFREREMAKRKDDETKDMRCKEKRNFFNGKRINPIIDPEVRKPKKGPGANEGPNLPNPIPCDDGY
jgi:hypothetical protein